MKPVGGVNIGSTDQLTSLTSISEAPSADITTQPVADTPITDSSINIGSESQTVRSEPPRMGSTGDDSCAINELLEGRMNLTVNLIQGDKPESITINLERSTAMMDILVKICNRYKLKCSDFRFDTGDRDYKASTPIGSLDVNELNLISRKKLLSMPTTARPVCLIEGPVTPFPVTFRLQVKLPHNQLMVYRVSPTMPISELKPMICGEKDLDIERYELTATVDRRILVLSDRRTIGDYGITSVMLISKSKLTDIEHYYDTNESRKFEHKPAIKPKTKRPAPPPPQQSTVAAPVSAGNDARPHMVKISDDVKRIDSPLNDDLYETGSLGSNGHHRQHSGSDSSGYHESVLSSESPGSSSTEATASGVSKSSSNLITVVPNDGRSSPASSAGVRKSAPIKKRKAPPPPKPAETSSRDENGKTNDDSIEKPATPTKSKTSVDVGNLSPIISPVCDELDVTHEILHCPRQSTLNDENFIVKIDKSDELDGGEQTSLADSVLQTDDDTAPTSVETQEMDSDTKASEISEPIVDGVDGVEDKMAPPKPETDDDPSQASSTSTDGHFHLLANRKISSDESSVDSESIADVHQKPISDVNQKPVVNKERAFCVVVNGTYKPDFADNVEIISGDIYIPENQYPRSENVLSEPKIEVSQIRPEASVRKSLGKETPVDMASKVEPETVSKPEPEIERLRSPELVRQIQSEIGNRVHNLPDNEKEPKLIKLFETRKPESSNNSKRHISRSETATPISRQDSPTDQPRSLQVQVNRHQESRKKPLVVLTSIEDERRKFLPWENDLADYQQSNEMKLSCLNNNNLSSIKNKIDMFTPKPYKPNPMNHHQHVTMKPVNPCCVSQIEINRNLTKFSIRNGSDASHKSAPIKVTTLMTTPEPDPIKPQTIRVTHDPPVYASKIVRLNSDDIPTPPTMAAPPPPPPPPVMPVYKALKEPKIGFIINNNDHQERLNTSGRSLNSTLNGSFDNSMSGNCDMRSALLDEIKNKAGKNMLKKVATQNSWQLTVNCGNT